MIFICSRLLITKGETDTTDFHPELECFNGGENSSGPDQWVGMIVLGAGASQDHLVGFPQLTILTGQSHISQLFPISHVFKEGEVKVCLTYWCSESVRLTSLELVKYLVTEGNGRSDWWQVGRSPQICNVTNFLEDFFLFFDVYSYVSYLILGCIWWKIHSQAQLFFSLDFIPIFTLAFWSRIFVSNVHNHLINNCHHHYLRTCPQ